MRANRRYVLLLAVAIAAVGFPSCGTHDSPANPAAVPIEADQGTRSSAGTVSASDTQACVSGGIPPAGTLHWPLEGRARDYRYSGWGGSWPFGACAKQVKKHAGLDVTYALDTSLGRKVLATQDGTASIHNLGNGWGLGVVLDHGGWTSTYEHITPSVQAGQWVRRGQELGRIASLSRSVPHLHFGIRMHAYDAFAVRGALPAVADKDHACSCNDGERLDPVWPEYFIDPTRLSYADDPALQPQIGQVRPTSVVGSAFTVTIDGSSFDPGGAIDQVYQPNGSFMGKGAIVSRSSSRIVVNESMAGAAPGTYTIRVKNPSGVLSNAASIRLYAEVRVTPSGGRAGTIFAYSGAGFSPYGATSHLRRPDGREFPLLPVATDSLGRFTRTINSAGFAAGVYSVWAVDKNTGFVTSAVAFRVQ
jgi:murein DD-endopeptidase MepM/ murein hydrolase activator NlpD